MTSLRRAATATAAATILALSLAACGDDGDADASEAPSDASQDDFCDAWNDAFEDLTTAGEKPSEDEWRSFQGKVEDLADVGTPEDISEGARSGFETFVEVVVGTDFEETDDFAGGLPGVTSADEANAEEFVTYAVTSCTELPTDLSTE